ncbi:MAG: hypothetical protein H7263_06490 [Candidatus Sericytochromatia bacterium]|nr:hypothetical protein [Candidatus Sericytochromatia bacterium]
MKILLIKPVKDVVIEDLIQYNFFHNEKVLQKLQATLKNLKKEKTSPEIADLGFLSHFYGDFYSCPCLDHVPVLIMQKEMKKTIIDFFKQNGLEVDDTILKSKQNTGDIFPNFDSIYELQTVLTLVINENLIQTRFNSKELKSGEFMKNTYDILDKTIQAHKLEQILQIKDTHTKKIKI